MSVIDRVRLERALPNLDVLVHYRRAWLRADVIAGVSVVAYLIPQVMGYAQVAGLPPVVGLWAIMASLSVYAIVGSSRQLSVGPESATSLMTVAIVTSVAAGDPSRFAALAAALAIIVGALAILAWIIRLGFLADLLSKPVLIGYMCGVAIVMVVGQLGKMTGVPMPGTSTLTQLSSYLRNVGDVNWPTVIVSVSTLLLLLVVGAFYPKLPMPLIGVTLSTIVVAVFGLDAHGVATVGHIPRGLPGITIPDISVNEIRQMLVPAIGIAVVGFSANVLTARAFAARHGQTIDANQELLGLGATNVAAGLIGGFPVSSSGSRTVIGDDADCRTQMHSLVAVVGVALTLLVAAPLLSKFPIGALGAIVVYAAVRLVDLAAFKVLAVFRRAEFGIAAVATAGVVIAGPLYGVLIAVGLSITDLVRRVARPHDGILGFVPGVAGMHDINDYPDAQLMPGLVVYRFDAPLFFVNAENFKRRALHAVDEVGQAVEWFVLNAEANVEVDSTALDALEALRVELENRKIVFAMARVKRDLRLDLDAAGFTERIGADRIYATLPTAVQAYEAWYCERHGSPPPGVRPPAPPPSPLEASNDSPPVERSRPDGG